MTTGASAQPSAVQTGVGPSLVAMRGRLGLVVLLFALAGVGWWWTARQMRGMAAGPWSALGGFGWFLGVWVVMMAAMMLPSVAPTVALYSRMTRNRSAVLALTFVGGYLLTWAAAGVAAVADRRGCVRCGRHQPGVGPRRTGSGRHDPARGCRLPAVTAQERVPRKVSQPARMLLGSWRDGELGALRMGMKKGAWCVGCCWALMASLFALGVMSVLWMAVVAGLIAIEKTLPWEKPATYGTAVVLLALGVMFLAAPSAIPGLTIPQGGGMSPMPGMGS